MKQKNPFVSREWVEKSMAVPHIHHHFIEIRFLQSCCLFELVGAHCCCGFYDCCCWRCCFIFSRRFPCAKYFSILSMEFYSCGACYSTSMLVSHIDDASDFVLAQWLCSFFSVHMLAPPSTPPNTFHLQWLLYLHFPFRLGCPQLRTLLL